MGFESENVVTVRNNTRTRKQIKGDIKTMDYVMDREPFSSTLQKTCLLHHITSRTLHFGLVNH